MRFPRLFVIQFKLMQLQSSQRANRGFHQSNLFSNHLYIPIQKQHLSKSLQFSSFSSSNTPRYRLSINNQSPKHANRQNLVEGKFQGQNYSVNLPLGSLTPNQSFQKYSKQDFKIKLTQPRSQTFHHSKNFRSKSTYGHPNSYRAQTKRYSHQLDPVTKRHINYFETDDKYGFEKIYRRGLIEDTKKAVKQFNKNNMQLLDNIKTLRDKVSDRATPRKITIRNSPQKIPTRTKDRYTLSTDYSETSQSYRNLQTAFQGQNQSEQSFLKSYSKRNITDSNFVILKKLGSGTFANVLLAVDKLTGFLVTLKKIKKNILKDQKCQHQLITEVKIQLFANHPNILKIYGFYSDSQNFTLILEFMEEGNLYQKLKKSNNISEEQTSQSICEILFALKYLHDHQIIHRDIKPENVVLTHKVRKLCDFGTAAISLNRRSTFCGTLDYSAPELIQGRQYNTTLDLWSLGVMNYELLTGKPPFYHMRRKDTIKQIVEYRDGDIKNFQGLSAQSIDFMCKFLTKDPQKRLSLEEALKHKFIEIHADEQTRQLTQNYMKIYY